MLTWITMDSFTMDRKTYPDVVWRCFSLQPSVTFKVAELKHCFWGIWLLWCISEKFNHLVNAWLFSLGQLCFNLLSFTFWYQRILNTVAHNLENVLMLNFHCCVFSLQNAWPFWQILKCFLAVKYGTFVVQSFYLPICLWPLQINLR